MITVSEWLLEFFRSCPCMPGYLLYNSIGEEANSIAILENVEERKSIKFVDGSFVSSLPFMLIMSVNQNEANEITLQKDFSNILKWLEENNPKGQGINDMCSVMEMDAVTNLTPVSRFENGDIQYQAIFNLKYFQGVIR